MFRCLLVYLFLLFISIDAYAQLRVCNHSFEWDGVPNGIFEWWNPPECWENCACDGSPNGLCTVDHYLEDIATIGLAQDDSMFVGLVAPYEYYYGESIGGMFTCAKLLANVKYDFSFYAIVPSKRVNPNPTSRPPPYLDIYLGNSYCDTNHQKVFSELVYADTLVKWEKQSCSFIADDDYGFLRLGIRHTFKDSTAAQPYWFKTQTTLRLDNISDFTPDTIYNSEHTPIISNASHNTICKGGILALKSPYGNIADQHWYRNSTHIGTGEKVGDTVFAAARYTLVVGHSDTCVRSVLIKDIEIKTDCADIVVPNAFSPNGDGVNDVWRLVNKNYILAQGIEIKQVQVYNRWGNKVFEASSNDFKWDGSEYPMDVYYYYIRYKNKQGDGSIAKGSITLIR